MKRIRQRILVSINLMLASVIAALGVAGCSHQKAAARQQEAAVPEEDNLKQKEVRMPVPPQEQMVCKYGVPRAEYIVHGTVTDSKGKPLRNKEMTVRSRYDEMYVKTDDAGVFDLHFDGFPAEEMIFEIDGKKYIRPVNYDGNGTDTWNMGTATMQVEIKHETGRLNDGHEPIVVMYGVPPEELLK